MLPRYPKATPGLEWTEMEGGFVAHDPASDRIHHLNVTGALILELCNGAHTVEEIARIVQGCFGLADPPAGEVRRLLQQALDEGLIS